MEETKETKPSDQERFGSAGVGTYARQFDAPTFNYNPKPGFSSEFSQSVDLSGRISVDEHNKVYECHLCEFRTAFRNSLLNHQAVHSDSRPWVCNMCDYAAKRKQDLKKHLHTIHGVMVDSTMLRPVLGSPKLSLQCSDDNNSSDGAVKGNTLLLDGNGVHEPQSEAETARTESYSQRSPSCHPNSIHSSVKQEVMSPGQLLPRTSLEPDNRSGDEEPEDDLPMAFSQPVKHLKSESTSDEHTLFNSLPITTVPVVSSSSASKFPDHARLSQGSLNMAKHFLTMPTHQQYPLAHNRISPFGHQDPTAIPSSETHFPAQMKKRHHLSDSSHSRVQHPEFIAPNSTDAATPTRYHGPTQAKRPRSPDKDSDGACTSSGSVANSRSSQTSQTKDSFLCEHCNIMFFQRAMYMMHMGLHSNDNPWKCTVCGGTFTEVYSFTSHFINQH